MKIILIILGTILINSKILAQEDVSIRDVLQKETTAFFKHDFITSYTFWHIIPQSVAIVSETDGRVLYLTGHELNTEYTAKALQSAIFPDRFERSNWLIRVKGSTAYVSFQQSVFTGNAITGQTYESRYMEKIAGQWKIISMTVVNFKNK